MYISLLIALFLLLLFGKKFGETLNEEESCYHSNTLLVYSPRTTGLYFSVVIAVKFFFLLVYYANFLTLRY